MNKNAEKETKKNNADEIEMFKKFENPSDQADTFTETLGEKDDEDGFKGNRRTHFKK